MSEKMHAGHCECGSVSYQIAGPLRDVVNCHCKQCQRTHGNFSAYTAAKLQDLVFVNEEGLKWYSLSSKSKRGFCQECGGSLFWQANGKDYICIDAGSLNAPTGLKSSAHIFVASAGDYYQIVGEQPNMPEGLEGECLQLDGDHRE